MSIEVFSLLGLQAQPAQPFSPGILPLLSFYQGSAHAWSGSFTLIYGLLVFQGCCNHTFAWDMDTNE